MKALSICQPWAWAIMEGHKHVENRTWCTHYRGRLLIHAGQSRAWWDKGCDLLVEAGIVPPQRDEVVWGAIIGSVELIRCSPLLHVCTGHAFVFGPWCWFLENCERCTPSLPYKGHQRLFEVDLLALQGRAESLFP